MEGPFDERGNQTIASYFGIDGKSCLSNDGYTGWKARLDERGNEDELSYFEKTDRRALPARTGMPKSRRPYSDEPGKQRARHPSGNRRQGPA